MRTGPTWTGRGGERPEPIPDRPPPRDISGLVELETPRPAPELVEVLAAALERWPDRRSELPGWWSGTLWAYELVEGKPSPADVALALSELRGRRAA